MNNPARVLTDGERVEHQALSAKIIETVLSPLTADEARLNAMVSSPLGTIAWLAVHEAGGGQRGQDLALGIGQAAEGVAMVAGPRAGLEFLNARTGKSVVETITETNSIDSQGPGELASIKAGGTKAGLNALADLFNRNAAIGEPGEPPRKPVESRTSYSVLPQAAEVLSAAPQIDLTRPEGTAVGSQIAWLKQSITALRASDSNTHAVDPVALRHLMNELPGLKTSLPNDLQAFAAQTLQLPNEAVSLRLVTAQGTPGIVGAKGASGAPVYLVRGDSGELLGAVKVFPSKQIGQMAGELFAMQVLDPLKLQNFHSIHVLAAGKLADGGGVLVLSPAKGEAIDDLMIRAGKAAFTEREAAMAELRQAVRVNGAALAEFHTNPEGSSATQATALDSQIDSAIDIAREISESVEQVNRRLPRHERLDLNPAELRSRVNDLAEGLRRNPGPASLAHGDFHPGNIFFDRQAGITVIDSGRLIESASPAGLPIGSPARDVAAFAHKLGTFGVRYGLEDSEIEELRTTFEMAYMAHGPMMTPEAIQFSRARVALGVFLTALKQQKDAGQRSIIDDALKKQLELFKTALDLR